MEQLTGLDPPCGHVGAALLDEEMIVIRSADESERVINHIQQLSGAAVDAPEEKELIALVDAADHWDRSKGWARETSH